MGLLLFVAGIGLTIAGGLGLAGGGKSAAAPVATVSAPATAAAPTTTVAAERPDQFLALFVKALRDGDRNFLFDRFHPVVIERYGEQQCRDHLCPASP